MGILNGAHRDPAWGAQGSCMGCTPEGGWMGILNGAHGDPAWGTWGWHEYMTKSSIKF